MLNLEQKNNLIKLIDYEIEHFLCMSAPKYQSFENMHIKHQASLELSDIKQRILLQAYALTNQMLNVDKCWFNVLKKDSDYEFHAHDTLTAVYFLDGCNENGTLISDGKNIVQLSSVDNTVQFIGTGVLHSIPKWSSVDRYSIAFELRGPT